MCVYASQNGCTSCEFVQEKSKCCKYVKSHINWLCGKEILSVKTYQEPQESIKGLDAFLCDDEKTVKRWVWYKAMKYNKRVKCLTLNSLIELLVNNSDVVAEFPSESIFYVYCGTCSEKQNVWLQKFVDLLSYRHEVYAVGIVGGKCCETDKIKFMPSGVKQTPAKKSNVVIKDFDV